MELCAFVGREKCILGNCHLHSLLCALHIILYFVALDGIICSLCIDCDCVQERNSSNQKQLDHPV